MSDATDTGPVLFTIPPAEGCMTREITLTPEGIAQIIEIDQDGRRIVMPILRFDCASTVEAARDVLSRADRTYQPHHKADILAASVLLLDLHLHGVLAELETLKAQVQKVEPL